MENNIEFSCYFRCRDDGAEYKKLWVSNITPLFRSTKMCPRCNKQTGYLYRICVIKDGREFPLKSRMYTPGDWERLSAGTQGHSEVFDPKPRFLGLYAPDISDNIILNDNIWFDYRELEDA